MFVTQSKKDPFKCFKPELDVNFLCNLRMDLFFILISH